MFKIDDVKKAKGQILDGSLTIWNARLEALLDSGKVSEAAEHLIKPVETKATDMNGNCHGCNGNTEFDQLESVLGSVKPDATSNK